MIEGDLNEKLLEKKLNNSISQKINKFKFNKFLKINFN